jgi:hypothetical protein
MRNMNIKWIFILIISLVAVFLFNNVGYKFFDDETVGRYIFTILVPAIVGWLGAIVFSLWR